MWEALEADLLAAGFALADYPDRLSLRAIRNFLVWSRDGSAAYRQANGERAGWHHVEELLARILEVLMAANWQRAGDKTAPRPKPLPRPGERREGDRHFGDEPVTIAEFHRRWRKAAA